MKKKRCRPRWWQLYLLGVGTIGLFVLVARAQLPERGREAAALGALVLLYGLIHLWLRANSQALLYTDQLRLVREERPDNWGAAGFQHTAILVSWPEPDRKEAARESGREHTPQERSE
jgi:hypothetical protein